MSNHFFNITAEDFQIVASRHGVVLAGNQANDLVESLDDQTEYDLIRPAKSYITLNNQTEVVHKELEIFLMEKGIIPQGENKFGEDLEDEDDDFDDEDMDDE